MLKFDENELVAVAKAVLRFNRHAKGYKPIKLVNEMKGLAYRHLDDEALGYVATRGFVLSAFHHPDGGIGIKASVSASILNEEA